MLFLTLYTWKALEQKGLRFPISQIFSISCHLPLIRVPSPTFLNMGRLFRYIYRERDFHCGVKKHLLSFFKFGDDSNEEDDIIACS